MITLLLAAGFAVLFAGGELLVRGASQLARRMGIPHLVIGLTVVAFGTSTPELAVSALAAVKGETAIALGNVVGSNIANVLLILGLSAALAPLAVENRLVRMDVPIMIGASVLVLLLALDTVLGRFDGLLLTAGIVFYLVFLLRTAGSSRTASREPASGDMPAGRAHAVTSPPLLCLLFIIVGIALLVIGSRWLVRGAGDLAALMGISSLVVGLTVVAVGTSLPELATSVVAALRGEREIAVGNIVGSNLFNLLAVLGISALLAPGGIGVPRPVLTFDLPVMIVSAAACLPIFFTGRKISRGEGALFLIGYAVYVFVLYLKAAG